MGDGKISFGKLPGAGAELCAQIWAIGKLFDGIGKGRGIAWRH